LADLDELFQIKQNNNVSNPARNFLPLTQLKTFFSIEKTTSSTNTIATTKILNALNMKQ
jgi:hypothetical protein